MLNRGCTALALAGCLLAGTATASQAGAGDAVTADGATVDLGAFKTTLTLSATSGSNGENPAGHARGEGRIGGELFSAGNALLNEAPSGPFSFSGKVTCVSVHGNKAVVKYGFEESADPAVLKDGGIEVFITDNGPGNNDTAGFLPPQDAASWQLADPTRCDALDLSPFQVKSGDYQVTDG